MTTALAPEQVRVWALEVVEARVNGRSDEDSLIEFKQQMPADAQRVARRIAGQGNSARGQPFIWVLGVCDDRTLVAGCMPTDPADYWPQIWSWFDGQHPEVIEVGFEFQGVRLLALGFNCEEGPFVVRTGTEPSFELPWRSGSRIQSANRSQMKRAFTPVAKLPRVEVRNIVEDPTALIVFLFVSPPSSDRIMLPQHQSVLEYGETRITATKLVANKSALIAAEHPTITEAKGQGLYFSGPGECVAVWPLAVSKAHPHQCRARLTFEPGQAEVVVTKGMPTR